MSAVLYRDVVRGDLAKIFATLLPDDIKDELYFPIRTFGLARRIRPRQSSKAFGLGRECERGECVSFHPAIALRRRMCNALSFSEYIKLADLYLSAGRQ